MKWCLEAESNHRHGDFQSPALPTELSRHLVVTGRIMLIFVPLVKRFFQKNKKICLMDRFLFNLFKKQRVILRYGIFAELYSPSPSNFLPEKMGVPWLKFDKLPLNLGY